MNEYEVMLWQNPIATRNRVYARFYKLDKDFSFIELNLTEQVYANHFTSARIEVEDDQYLLVIGNRTHPFEGGSTLYHGGNRVAIDFQVLPNIPEWAHQEMCDSLLDVLVIQEEDKPRIIRAKADMPACSIRKGDYVHIEGGKVVGITRDIE